MLTFLAIVLDATGLLILVAALRPTRKLIAELPDGPMRAQWRLFARLLLVFALGCASVELDWGRSPPIAHAAANRKVEMVLKGDMSAGYRVVVNRLQRSH